MSRTANLETLSVENVLKIHDVLIADFAAAKGPISPAGVRSMSLLESADNRQLTSLGSRLKYTEPVPNAATLLFGVCNDHPFHNGNKQTSLISMLAHLDKNRLTLKGTRQKDLFDLMKAVVTHELSPRARKIKAASAADREVQAIYDWIRRRASNLVRGERQITFRQLRKRLSNFGFELDRDPMGIPSMWFVPR